MSLIGKRRRTPLPHVAETTLMSSAPGHPMEEDRIKRASGGLYPVISMQPTLRGRAGEPVGIVMAESFAPRPSIPTCLPGWPPSCARIRLQKMHPRTSR